jgi:hypothetical protein
LNRATESEPNESADPFRLRLTPIGLSHPLFRLLPDEVENQALWQRMMPLYWNAGPRKLKPAAEVLADRNRGSAFSLLRGCFFFQFVLSFQDAHFLVQLFDLLLQSLDHFRVFISGDLVSRSVNRKDGSGDYPSIDLHCCFS